MTLAPRIGLSLPVPQDLAATLEAAAWAEREGYEGVWLADSGDLGFTSGEIHPPERATGRPTNPIGSYLRVWRRDARGPWRVAAEVLIPSSRG